MVNMFLGFFVVKPLFEFGTKRTQRMIESGIKEKTFIPIHNWKQADDMKKKGHS